MKLIIFVSCVLFVISCAHHSCGLSHDSNIGYCSNISQNRSVPVMAKMIHKPNNKYFKLFRKTDVTMRFPEVNNVLDI